MKKVLFITHDINLRAACGMGIIGDLYANALKDHPNYEVKILYTDELQHMIEVIRDFQPTIVFNNYSNKKMMPWLSGFDLELQFPHIKFVAVNHETTVENAAEFMSRIPWNYVVVPDKMVQETDRIFTIDRLIPDGPTVSYQEPAKPIIGYQGFGPPHKRIFMIAYKVLEEFDEAIIRLHIPFGFYGDPYGNDARTRVEEVKWIVSPKPGIEVVASHELLDRQSLVNLLAQNTVNCYFNDELYGNAIASSPDYAIAARRPIAVTRSYQLRNFWSLTPSVMIEETSLRTIISNGFEPLQPLLMRGTREVFLDNFSRIIETLTN